MHYIFALFALLLTIQLLPTAADAQTDSRKSAHSTQKRASARKTTAFQKQTISAEIERQQQFLRGVSSRFEAVALNDFTPLFEYAYVWTALRDNRVRMSRPDVRLTAADTKAVTDAYDSLEKEVVASFGDHQLAILNDVLELNDQQFMDIQRVVEDDLSSRRDLLKSKELGGGEFSTKLSAISDRTQNKIVSLLFPEQRKKFEKQVRFTRDRLLA